MSPNLLAMDLMVSPGLTVYLRAISGVGVGSLAAVGSGRSAAGGSDRAGAAEAGAVGAMVTKTTGATVGMGVATGAGLGRGMTDSRGGGPSVIIALAVGAATPMPGRRPPPRITDERHHPDQHHAATHQEGGHTAPVRARATTTLAGHGSRVDRDGDSADERSEPGRLQSSHFDVVLRQRRRALLPRTQEPLTTAVRLG